MKAAVRDTVSSYVQVDGVNIPLRTKSCTVKKRIGENVVGEGYAYYRNFSIAAANVDADVTYFPVYLYITDLDKTHILNSGADFIAKDSAGNRIPLEIESYNSDGETGILSAWIQLPAISSTEATTFTLHYGSAVEGQPDRDAAYGMEAVWESAFKTVHHLADKTGDATKVTDSSSSDFEGTKSLVGGDTITEDDGATSDKCQQWTNADAAGATVIDLGIDLALNPSDITVMFWAKHKTVSAQAGVDRGGGNCYTAVWPKGAYPTFVGKDSAGTGISFTANNNAPGANDWNHFIFVYGLVGETVTHDIYTNGVVCNHSGGGGNGSIKEVIGTQVLLGKYSLSYLNGWMDEVMILDEIKDAGWYTTLYNALNHRNEAFYTQVGDETGATATTVGSQIEIINQADSKKAKKARWKLLY